MRSIRKFAYAAALGLSLIAIQPHWLLPKKRAAASLCRTRCAAKTWFCVRETTPSLSTPRAHSSSSHCADRTVVRAQCSWWIRLRRQSRIKPAAWSSCRAMGKASSAPWNCPTTTCRCALQCPVRERRSKARRRVGIQLRSGPHPICSCTAGGRFNPTCSRFLCGVNRFSFGVS